MSASRLGIGQLGERIAGERLRSEGYAVVARNARTRYGEIDLIALRESTLVFVEVKTLRSGAGGPERPALSVGRAKQLRLRRLATAWLATRPPLSSFDTLRFDVIGIRVGPGGRPVEYEHIRDAF